ncbi:TetR/AcrR family transcriptional regulator [Acinetobacter sp. MB5]|uniref:TetR/AcrR family transcriptional regulator n=1 Tax=Acinetobacter sp. MB5 TaxID=2069438 RepID=UPI000DD056DC|nr:TetR/AcrR family transcriptional regulator [Acinetobacter sp. MB5]
MSRTGRPREFNRDKAIDSAMNLFWEKGFESTSLADLRQTLNLSSASFYAAFGSKKILYAECLNRYMETCGQVTIALDDLSISPRKAIENMLHQTISMQTSTLSPSGCMAVLSGLNCCDENKEVEQLTKNVRKQTRDAISRCVLRGIESGELPENTNVEVITLMIDCFVKGIAIQARDHVSKDQLLAAADTLLQCWKV